MTRSTTPKQETVSADVAGAPCPRGHVGKRRRFRWTQIWHLVALAGVTALAVAFAFPLYWMVIGSVKSAPDIARIPPEWWPLTPTMENYQRLFGAFPTIRWTLNSAVVSTVAMALSILFGSMAGYALARYNIPFGRIIIAVFVAAMMMPREVVMVPLFLFMSKIGWLNTYHGLFLPLVAVPYATFLFYQFMKGLPDELFDAARIDGASELTAYWRIAMPLSKPAIGIVGILTFVVAWNDYMWQLVMVNREDMTTLPVAISTAITSRTLDFGLGMAAATYAALPIVVLFFLFQKHFVKGLTLGAVK